MSIDTEDDIIALKKAGQVVAQVMNAMRDYLRPGISTEELDNYGYRLLKEAGARPAPALLLDFPGATCISVNEEAAHGIPGNRVVKAGDLVNIDVSAELNGYFADTGASYPVPPVPQATAYLCACTREALQEAMKAARAGVRISEIGRAVEKVANKRGLSIIKNLTGHGVGRSLHEEPKYVLNYYDKNEKRKLTEGLVITIEPFLSTGVEHVIESDDGWTLVTPDGSLSAQYEHSMIITKGHPIILTSAA